MKTLFLLSLSLFSGALLANAQCNAQPEDTPALRDTGVHEKIGDILIVCSTAGYFPPTPSFNLSLFASPLVHFTSRITHAPTHTSEALLLIGSPALGTEVVCNASNRETCNAVPGTLEGIGPIRFKDVPSPLR